MLLTRKSRKKSLMPPQKLGEDDPVRQKIQALRQSGNAAEALGILENLLKEYPQDLSLLKLEANIRADIGDDRGVVAALDRVQAIEPLGQHTAALYAQAVLRLARQEALDLRRSGQTDQAISLLEKLLAEYPRDVALLKSLANAKAAIQDYRGTLEVLDRVRAIEPLGEQTTALYERASHTLYWNRIKQVYYYRNSDAPDRLPVDDMIAKLAAYDVISFDIFDTAIVRAVAQPEDVFRLMGQRLGVTDFVKKRKAAEMYARAWNDRLKGSREVTLDHIYGVMAEQAGATDGWAQLEKQLEIQLTRQNPYIFYVYEQLRSMGKTLVFTSDMYLPRETIEAMLARAGYTGYERIYLSNEHSARKGDGTLQRILMADITPGQAIIHVGDALEGDVNKTIAAGMAAVYNPNQHGLVREGNMNSLAGSFYEAVIDNAIGTGMWSKGIHYTHGFRVGGILTLGYVEFLERLAREKNIDKILFLGRDCDILSKVYHKFFGTLPSAYIDTSRVAALMLTTDENFDDYIGRTFFRWFKDSNNSRPISQVMEETGFDYLVEHLEAADIEPLQFPASANEPRLRDFFWSKKDIIESHLAETGEIARDYFAAAIGQSQRVLLVDIGWTGTCITVLRDFFRRAFGGGAPQVFGALLATSRNTQITDAVSDGSISSYIYSPTMNQDFMRAVMPGGRIPQRQRDFLTHPIEYLFTEPQASTIGYRRDAAGNITAIRGDNTPPNPEQIADMQAGVIDFIDRYLDYSKGLTNLRTINAYVAFQPLRNALSHRPYLYAVYKDFLYDAAPVLHGGRSVFGTFGALFSDDDQRAAMLADAGEEATTATDKGLPKILFVSPEMTYTGTPHSLLRLCKVAKKLGYEPIVWSSRSGPFSHEFEANGFPVTIVPADQIGPDKIDALIRDNVRLVVCNTVVTDRYVHALEGRIPVVWYVREATNVPQFLRGNPGRAQTLRHSSSITVVSDYAAQALRHYTDGPIDVVKNAAEDVSDLALPYVPAKDGIVRFVQLGTIEHRKGYDLFVAAYKAMPEAYRVRAELHFAGGFINSGTGFASYLFGQTQGEPRIHYHGLISDETQKIELLSQMDVVVVASRDESCSLVALEGAMLSKPLIVTENVGAKYMVDASNGLIVPSGDVVALRDALMRMIDLQEGDLVSMGRASRTHYDALASMDAHQRDLGELFARRIAAGPGALPPEPEVLSPEPMTASDRLIVSLTSFPPRMPTIATCIETLRMQTLQPERILLWLSADQFPHREDDLPAELLELVDAQFEIRWVDGDLGPHKKYFYAMQEFPDASIITVDDDVRYDPELVATLYQAHLDHPQAIIAGRANLVRFRPDGTLRTYDHWGYEHQHMRETETYALLPTGIGGVLYPPGAIPVDAFHADDITDICLHADDLWLKFMATANGRLIWMPNQRFDYRNIVGSQNAALWRMNSFQSGNDEAIARILDLMERRYGIADKILQRIRGVRPDGLFIGPGDEPDRSSLLK